MDFSMRKESDVPENWLSRREFVTGSLAGTAAIAAALRATGTASHVGVSQTSAEGNTVPSPSSVADILRRYGGEFGAVETPFTFHAGTAR